MQTFLPSRDFSTAANMLDSKRLNKQILEGYQILKVLNNPDPRAGWRNHPAVKMWKGYENTLFIYIMAMVKEARMRGIKTDKNWDNLINLRVATIKNWGSGYPKWYQNSETLNRIITTHRANLYKKDPEYYYEFYIESISPDNKPCCDSCQYFWATHTKEYANV